MIDPPDLADTCLFLDVDGTLVEFASTPQGVHIDPALIQTLPRARGALNGALALVSGRRIETLDGLFSPLRFAAAGIHGAEMRFTPDGPIESMTTAPLSRDLHRKLLDTVQNFPGTFVEDKSFAFAVHFRAAPRFSVALIAAVDEIIAELGDPSLDVLHGNGVSEIKRGAYDKGGAIARLMATPEFSSRKPIFIGDDTTDLPGFAAVLERGGLAYSVGSVVPGVSGTFDDPAAVRAWVAELAPQGGAAA